MGYSGNLYAQATEVITSQGDLRRGDSSGNPERLAIGSSGKVLQSNGTTESWETLTTADSVLTTQGDVLYEGASGLARLGQSTDGFVLTTKGASANPVWASAGGGATVEAVSDRLGATKTTTSSTLVVADTGFTIDLPTITDGKCMVTANLVTLNSDAGSTATSSIYDVTNTAVLTAMQTTGAGGQSATQAITTDADGDTVRVYFSAPAGNTAYVLGSTGTTTSLESTGQISALGVG